MKKILSTIISMIFIYNFSLAQSLYFQDANISDIESPWIITNDTGGGESLITIIKIILNRALEYLPILILILLLAACLKIIFDGDGKAGLKRIKYILIGIALMILCIYFVNVLSAIFVGHPIININFQ